MSDTKILLEGLAFPEGPRWHDGRLWFSDMHDYRVKTVDENGASENVVEVPEWPSGLGFLSDGSALIVSMRNRRLLRFKDGTLSEFADLTPHAPWHCNDMVTDGRDNSYVGNFGIDIHTEPVVPAPTTLVLVAPDGAARVVAEDLWFPNGTVVTPDGSTLVVGESYGARLTAFDIEPDGSLTNRRVFAQLDGAVPDGICLDAEGAIWVANPLAPEVLRVREGGAVTARVETTRNAFACMLGGSDGRTLFICTSDSSDPVDAPKLMSGRIETLRVDVAHAGRP